ncbi:MAG: class I SAM-dependent methyltransferase [Deltaproteobacteria bacterium]|nr:class I SAM-dependent methyltransferase [Deltaproteobacteria bacterium]
MSNGLLLPVCPNGCDGELYQTSLAVAEGALRMCPSCGQIVSSCTKERYELSNQDWNTEKGTWPSEKDMRRLMRRKTRDIAIISDLLTIKTDIHLLDVGCSNGAFVSFANSLGLNAEGVDPSEKAVRNGIDRGLNIHLGYLHEVAFQDDAFDAITLYEVIEHLNEPKVLLKECHRILKPNGVLVIGTGNVNSWTRRIRKSKWDFFDMMEHGGHISFFSPKSLDVLASRTGFVVKKARTSSVKFYEKGEVPYLLYRMAKIFSEMLNIPARIFNKGHQMEVYLVANKTKA